MGTKKRRPRPASGIRIRKVRVTPTLAKEWLVKNTKNRPCPPGAVQRYARAMLNLEWRENGDTIKFDEDGVLRDGQTRLRAIIVSGRALDLWVAWDLPRDSFDTIDQGRPRSLGHVISCNEYAYYHELAGAVKFVYTHDPACPPEPGGLRTAIGLRMLKERPAFLEATKCLNLPELNRIGCSKGMAIGLYVLMTERQRAGNGEMPTRFFDNLANGVAGKRNPICVLRDLMLANKHARPERKLTPTYIAAVTIKAWNLFLTGRKCTYLRWNSEKEAFPAIA